MPRPKHDDWMLADVDAAEARLKREVKGVQIERMDFDFGLQARVGIRSVIVFNTETGRRMDVDKAIRFLKGEIDAKD